MSNFWGAVQFSLRNYIKEKNEMQLENNRLRSPLLPLEREIKNTPILLIHP